MKMEISLTEALCGMKRTILTPDHRTLVIQTIPGEVTRHNHVRCVFSEGMPTYRNPFEKGKLIIQV
jgi:DnaJ family protein A protein 1